MQSIALAGDSSCDGASRRCKGSRWQQRLVIAVTFAALLHPFGADGACLAPAGAQQTFIDPATTACTKAVCVGSYQQCCGNNPDACHSSSQTTDTTEKLQLVFSDEFNNYPKGVLGSPGDPRWTAMDFHYSSDKNEWQNYKPEYVTVEDGKLLLTMHDKPSQANRYGYDKTDVVNANKTSGMVQGWNKFCFTGGLVEFSVRLPGNNEKSGFWAAAWLMGNLGRAGHYPSLEGMWPFSYDSCANGSDKHDWNDNKVQRISKCNTKQGRGAPEIDVLEYGILGGDKASPQYVHTMQMGPVAPPNTSWMLPDPSTDQVPGVRLPGRDSGFKTFLGKSFGELSRPGYPRTGSKLTDTYTGSSYLTSSTTYWDNHHIYSLLWEPGEFVRWYLDDQLLFEVGKEALRAQTSNDADKLTVEERLIPKEPLYIIMNLAMSNGAWARVADNLVYPANMSVDYVRVYQRPTSISVGCDPPGYPTTQYISCQRNLYLGDSEQGLWRLPYCKDFWGQENQFLFGLAIATVAVLVISSFLWFCMQRAYHKEQQQAKDLTHGLPPWLQPEALQRPAEQRIRDCYINRNGQQMEQLLHSTRPDLLEAAKARQAGAL